MNDKPLKLPMEFGETLARLARVPKAAVVDKRETKQDKAKASQSPPRPVRPSGRSR